MDNLKKPTSAWHWNNWPRGFKGAAALISGAIGICSIVFAFERMPMEFFPLLGPSVVAGGSFLTVLALGGAIELLENK